MGEDAQCLAGFRQRGRSRIVGEAECMAEASPVPCDLLVVKTARSRSRWIGGDAGAAIRHGDGGRRIPMRQDWARKAGWREPS